MNNSADSRPHWSRKDEWWCGVSPTTARRLINRGLIQPNRALRHIPIAVDELDRFLQSGGSQ